MRAIILVVDGLGAGYLGPYGCTWLDTPELNRLTARASTWDNCLVDCLNLRDVYDSYWTGTHALQRQSEAKGRDDRQTLAQVLRAHDVATRLITDESMVAEHPCAEGFGERVLIESPEASEPASSEDEVALADFLAACLSHLQVDDGKQLTWIHARAMSHRWDAPLDLRRKYLDDDEELEPYLETVPPRWDIHGEVDPDEVTRLVHAYAAEVMSFDFCLGALLDQLREFNYLEDTLFLITSPRGYPLGEHGRVGQAELLFGESLHVPLIACVPSKAESMGISTRYRHFVQCPDLFASVLGWFQVNARECWGADSFERPGTKTSPLFDRAVSVAGSTLAMRTAAWFWQHDTESDKSLLFGKPDDRWEVNEISDRCPDAVALLRDALAATTRAAQVGSRADLTPLDESLTDPT